MTALLSFKNSLKINNNKKKNSKQSNLINQYKIM